MRDGTEKILILSLCQTLGFEITTIDQGIKRNLPALPWRNSLLVSYCFRAVVLFELGAGVKH